MISRLWKENVKEFLIAADMYCSARVKAASFDFLYKNRRVWSENILKSFPCVRYVPSSSGLRAEMMEKTSTIERMSKKENQKLLRAGKVWTDNEETALKEFLNSNDKMEDAKKMTSKSSASKLFWEDLEGVVPGRDGESMRNKLKSMKL